MLTLRRLFHTASKITANKNFTVPLKYGQCILEVLKPNVDMLKNVRGICKSRFTFIIITNNIMHIYLFNQ